MPPPDLSRTPKASAIPLPSVRSNDNTGTFGDPATEPEVPKDPVQLIVKWDVKAKVFRDAHYAASVRLRLMHYYIGIPSIVLSAIVGTAVFATLERTVDIGAKLVVAFISVAAAVLAAVQTFLRFSERSEAHRQAYAGYDGVVREIEQALVLGKSNEQVLDHIRKRLDTLASAPELATRDMSRAADALDVQVSDMPMPSATGRKKS